METIILRTKDGVEIVADYYEPSDEESNPSSLKATARRSKGVILLHMMPATRESWRELAPQLTKRGYHVVAPDLRGHGESEGGPNGYEEFSNEEHQASIQDVETAYEFLQSEGVKDVAVVGASIGANLAIQFLAEHKEATVGVFLSPGLDYKGLRTLPLVKQLHEGQKVLFVASRDDERSTGNCADMNEELVTAVPDGVIKKLITYDAAGHGTDMFRKEEPDLAAEILKWIAGPSSS